MPAPLDTFRPVDRREEKSVGPVTHGLGVRVVYLPIPGKFLLAGETVEHMPPPALPAA